MKTRNSSAKWDYLPKGLTLPEVSKKLYNKDYIDTSNKEVRKIKKYINFNLKKN